MITEFLFAMTKDLFPETETQEIETYTDCGEPVYIHDDGCPDPRCWEHMILETRGIR